MWWLTRRRAPSPGFILQWHISERCNLRCAHCYQEAAPGELPFDAMLGVLPQFTALLDSLALERGQINITGGEPLLHPRFFDLLEAVAAQPRFSFAVLTNGSGIDRATARRLARLRPAYVQVSIDGVRETHDRLRGAGSFDSAVAGLRNLIAAGVVTSVSFTAHRGNFREFPEVAQLARRLRARRVWADRLIPMGRGAELETLTAAETQAFVQLLRTARGEASRTWFNRTTVAMHRALQFLEGGAAYRCTAGQSLLALLPDGTVLPCRRMPIAVGNIGQATLAAIYRDAPQLAELRDPTRLPCPTCPHQPRCRGGLRCLSHALTGTHESPDPGCWLPKN